MLQLNPNLSDLVSDAATGLCERFRVKAALTASAPGRVNLIGEHVDYCDGFVLPAAIGLRTWMTAGPRTDDSIRIETEEGLRVEFGTRARAEPGPEKWANYLRGVFAGCLAAGLNV